MLFGRFRVVGFGFLGGLIHRADTTPGQPVASPGCEAKAPGQPGGRLIGSWAPQTSHIRTQRSALHRTTSPWRANIRSTHRPPPLTQAPRQRETRSQSRPHSRASAALEACQHQSARGQLLASTRDFRRASSIPPSDHRPSRLSSPPPSIGIEIHYE
ncbi:hypothetical protein DFH27DRAFT_331041 [Peziza echinospora]|nr:hypothetical protein DFH27DRAFT_331041 [Peziza echinospora]